MEDSTGPSTDGLTPEEANRIIHSYRKVRYGTACWPCRQRKVKCDNKQPCQNCVRRGHAQLCSYNPSRPQGNQQSSNASDESGVGVGAPKKRALSPGSSVNSSSGRSKSAKATDGSLPVDTDNKEISRYLGQNSIPALLREQASPSHHGQPVEEVIRQDVRSILGLDNSAPFPLMSARQMDKQTLDISSELPSDREVMKLFHAYKEIPDPFWGFVIDINELENQLMVYLEDRAKYAMSGTKPQPAKPVSASWLAVLFSVLAVGSQYHDSPYHIRTYNAQKYIQISFHFLRVGNFLLRPNLDSIQALLLTGFVLLNDMKAEASWALLGLITRLAQSLGLDRVHPSDDRESLEGKKKDYLRRRLWWTIVWHDCLTSLSFDRAPTTAHTTLPIPSVSPNPTEGWVYLEGMYHLCQMIGTRLSPDVIASAPYEQIMQTCDDLEQIPSMMVPHIRSKEKCRSAIDRLHHYAIRLHTAFVVSVCCRPALRRAKSDHLTEEQKQILANKCKTNLTETVRMFLAMHQLSVIPTRSWAFTYHGLSSALLLGILTETKEDPEVRRLQGDLINALSATAAKEQRPSVPSHIQQTDRDIELSGPLSRALVALRNIYSHGNVHGNPALKKASVPNSAVITLASEAPSKTTSEADGDDAAAAGTGTDGTGAESNGAGMAAGVAAFGQNGTATTTAADDGLSVIPATTSLIPTTLMSGTLGGTVGPALADLKPTAYSTKDAALAMTEMQNGGMDLSMVPPISEAATADGLTDLSNMETSTYVSPMELYDQIFWENPEPWNMGADTMNFDFMAQPAPAPAQEQQQQQFYF